MQFDFNAAVSLAILNFISALNSSHTFAAGHFL